MKTSIALRSALPLMGLIMSSCEPSGQLLTGGLCTSVAVGAVAAGAVVSIVERFQKRRLAL